MKRNYLPSWREIHTIIFDFDGIFTDNNVYLGEDGKEIVKCSRADGLGLDMLRKFIIKKKWNVRYFILSKEKNPVVLARAKKLKIDCIHGVDNKLFFIKEYIKDNKYKESEFKKGSIYLGNDLNDYEVMHYCGTSVAPKDSHKIIIKNANIVLNRKGGDGFVREFIEKLISCNNLSEDGFLDLI